VAADDALSGVDGELSDDEGCEEQQSRFDRAGVREGHLDWPAAPTLAVDEDELAKTHVSHMLGKLGLRERVQAVVFAYESGVVERGER
jgi:hypothetical protein